jgi:hypothetical protein
MTKWGFSVVLIPFLVAPLAGCATTRGPRQISAVPSGGSRPLENWSRVSELAPATEVVVTVRGSRPGVRYFVLADEFSLTVLNLTDSTLPAASAHVLRDMASHHPERFAEVRASGAFVEGNVRVGRDGVFVADRKVADLGQVVETTARNDVAEIQGPVVARGSVPGAVLGGWLGFAVGVVPALGGAATLLASSFLMGSVVGGAFLGFHWSNHQTGGIVYRAPYTG